MLGVAELSLHSVVEMVWNSRQSSGREEGIGGLVGRWVMAHQFHAPTEHMGRKVWSL